MDTLFLLGSGLLGQASRSGGSAAPTALRVPQSARPGQLIRDSGSRVEPRLDLCLPVGKGLVQVRSVDRATDRLHPRTVRVVEQVAERKRERGHAVLETVSDELRPRVRAGVLVTGQVRAVGQVT